MIVRCLSPCRLLLPAVTVLLLICGCGHRAGQKQPSVRAAPEAAVPLPEWAPKNPSPEFLRAAQVLRPLPSDLRETGEDTAERAVRTGLIHDRVFLRTWELFGRLSDAQIHTFLRRKTVLVRVPDMTPQQKAAFQTLLDDWKGLTLQGQQLDLAVILYKAGARKDLSNVSIGFTTSPRKQATHMVLLVGEVRGEKEAQPIAIGPIGQI